MALTYLTGSWRKEDFTGNNLILNGGAPINGTTSGQTFCARTKVLPFVRKALNVSGEPGE